MKGQLPSVVIPHERATDRHRVWVVARAPRENAIDTDAAPVAELDYLGNPDLERAPRTGRRHRLKRILTA